MTKLVAHQHLAGHPPISLLKGFILLLYVENPGAFLGLGASLSSGRRFWLLNFSVALILAFLAAYALAYRGACSLQVVALSLIAGGGVSNLFDRVTLGIVRDFANVGIGPVRTGIFNLADVAIMTGVIVFVLNVRHGK